MKLFVGSLSYKTTEEDLRQAFEQFGQVVSARIAKNTDTGKSQGIGFVEMAGEEEATAAIREMDGKELLGRIIRVRPAHGANTE